MDTATDIEPVARFASVGNLRTGGEGRQMDALFEANRAALAAALNHEPARERLLADVDTYGDWLSAQCLGAPAQKLPYIGRHVPDMDSLKTPLLVALTLYPRADIQVAAMDEIKARYLRAFGVEG